VNMLRKTMAVAALIAFASTAFADEFATLGPRAMGMGDTGVASAVGDVAQYWNPGALTQTDGNTSGLQIPVGIQGAFEGPVLQGANDLYNVAKECQNASASCTQANITNALNDLNHPGEGALVDAAAMAGIKIGPVQLGIINESEFAAIPFVDDVHTSPNPGVDNVANNTSSLGVRAGIFTSANLSYAHSFFVPGLTVGATVKAIGGVMGYNLFSAVQNSAGSTGAFKNLTQDTKSTVQPGVDVGALWQLNKFAPSLPMDPKVGIVGRNLNDPKFDETAAETAVDGTTKYTLDRQVRAGAEISPFHFWHFSADVDLTKNNTLLNGLQSQQAGVGTEINVFNRGWINIPLRVGITKNFAVTGSNPSFTAGVGLDFLHIIVDLGGQISSGEVTTNGDTKVPTNAGASAQIGIMF
jgi:hypothetical protein